MVRVSLIERMHEQNRGCDGVGHVDTWERTSLSEEKASATALNEERVWCVQGIARRLCGFGRMREEGGGKGQARVFS